MSEPIPNGMTCGQCKYFSQCRSLIATIEKENRNCDWSPHKFRISDKARADASEAALEKAVGLLRDTTDLLSRLIDDERIDGPEEAAVQYTANSAFLDKQGGA